MHILWFERRSFNGERRRRRRKKEVIKAINLVSERVS